jgi:hypothetical protein
MTRVCHAAETRVATGSQDEGKFYQNLILGNKGLGMSRGLWKRLERHGSYGQLSLIMARLAPAPVQIS